MRKVSHKRCAENYNKHSSENLVRHEMWKNMAVARRQATDDNMAHAYCMPDT